MAAPPAGILTSNLRLAAFSTTRYLKTFLAKSLVRRYTDHVRGQGDFSGSRRERKEIRSRVRNWVGGHIPALQQGKGCYFSKEKILGGELALYLLHLVAVSVPVQQVGVGGHLWGG